MNSKPVLSVKGKKTTHLFKLRELLKSSEISSIWVANASNFGLVVFMIRKDEGYTFEENQSFGEAFLNCMKNFYLKEKIFPYSEFPPSREFIVEELKKHGYSVRE